MSAKAPRKKIRWDLWMIVTVGVSIFYMLFLLYPLISMLSKSVIGEDGGELNRMEMICARLFEDPTLLRNVDPKDALCKRKGEGRRID